MGERTCRRGVLPSAHAGQLPRRPQNRPSGPRPPPGVNHQATGKPSISASVTGPRRPSASAAAPPSAPKGHLAARYHPVMVRMAVTGSRAVRRPRIHFGMVTITSRLGSYACPQPILPLGDESRDCDSDPLGYKRMLA